MTNRKSTRHALLMSSISLLLCVSMLVGTTFAWFTDSVTSGVNQIVAGNLDVEVYYGDPADENSIKDVAKLFDDVNGKPILWEPGAVAYEKLTVANLGSLALKYQMTVTFDGATEAPEGKTLADVLKVAVVDATALTDRDAALTAAKAAGGALLKEFTLSGKLDSDKDLVADAETSKTYGVVIYWEPGANDNDFNMNNENQGTKLSINLGIKLVATQLTAEEDSWDETYDENAWADGMQVFSADDLQAAFASGVEKIVLGADIESENGFIIEKDAAINLNGHTLTATGDNITLFQVGDGANEGKDCNADLTIVGGKIVLQSTNGVLDGTGASTGAAIAVDFMSTGKLEILDTEIVGSRRGGKRAVEVGTGEGYLKNVTIDCAYGSGVNAYWGSNVVLDDCNITVNGMYSAPYNSVCFSAMYGAEITVNSGNYKLINDDTYITGDTHGGWVGIIMNSGGTITTNGGTFENVPAAGFNPAYERAIFEAENNAPAVATLNLLGGTFIPQKDKIYGGYGDQYYPTYNVPNLVDCGNGVWVAAPAGVDKVIMNAADLLALSGKYVVGNNGVAETITYSLMADIDMGGAEFKEIGVAYGDTVNFIGNNHTISNMKLGTGKHNGMTNVGMFYVDSGSTLNVSNLKLVNPVVVDGVDDYTTGAAAIVGYANGIVNLENVDVTGAQINNSKGNAAVYVGYCVNKVTLTDCDMADSVVTGEIENGAVRADKTGAFAGTVNTESGLFNLNNCTNGTSLPFAGRVIYGAKLYVNGGVPVSTTQQLIDAIKAAPVGEVTTIFMADGTYEGDIDITVDAMGTQGGDVVIKAMKDAKPVITGKVTIGYYMAGTGAKKWNANVTFEGITFDQAAAKTHSLSLQSLKSITLTGCTIIGDWEYGIESPRGNDIDASTIYDCTFENAAMQITGGFGSGLVIEECTFNDSCINVQAGDGVTIKECEFNATLTDVHNGDSFYVIRTSATGTPITVIGGEINVDSTVSGIAVPKAGKAFAVLHNRHGSKAWSITGLDITLTDAALAQTNLNVILTAGGAMNTTDVTVNGVQQ